MMQSQFFYRQIRNKVFAHVRAIAVNVTAVCEIDRLACQDEFFVHNVLDVKENYEHALDFALHLPRFFSVSSSLDFPCTVSAFFPERISLPGSPSHFLPEICTKCYAVPLLDLLRNRIRPDTRLQIKGRKNSARPRS
jgi:hypothetical protein